MNLQENIHRIQSVMGITENDGQSKIDKMINQIGLGGTVKFFGGYDKFKELYKGEITKEDKIDFINQSVKDKATEEEMDYIKVGDYIDDWIYYHLDDKVTAIIDILHVGFLRIEVYRMDDGITCVYQGDGNIMYEDLNDEQLNKVFNIVLEIV